MSRLNAPKLSSETRRSMPPPEQEEARRLVAQISRAFEAMLALGIARREAYVELQREALVANPGFLGVWVVWEKEALAGPDTRFRDTPGHDAAGRFLPYWHRESGDLMLDVVIGYERPGEGDWYWVPKMNRQPCTAEPYPYPFGSRIRWLASEIAPFAAQGRCLGVVGVDWTMEPLRPARPRASTFVHVLGGGLAAEKLSSLTSREHEVYFWLGQGKSNEEISIILGISAHTVKNHLDHIFQKLGVSNRLAAALAVQGVG
jgi:DNA-binding CsgD family transcriptional regulator